MSALALHYLEIGAQVYGYDRLRSRVCVSLEGKGAKIHYSEDPNQVPDKLDLVVYTPAIPQEHLEWEKLRKLGCRIEKRAKILGEISSRYKTIAVAGSHGKTSIASICSFLLNESIGCKAFLGGIANNYNSNYIGGEDACGASETVVVEADEYDRSFLQLSPFCSVVSAMEADHLDIYGTVEAMRQAYIDFLKKTSPKGKKYIAANCLPYIPKDMEYVCYGIDLNQAEAAPAACGEPSAARKLGSAPYATATNIRIENSSYIFDYIAKNGGNSGEAQNADAAAVQTTSIKALELNYPGRHNIENAVVAISIALDCGVKEEEIRKLLPKFKGVWRRFDVQLKTDQITYIDDYAHHPTEIKTTIETVRELYPTKRLGVIFQPHLYSRTRDLAEEFAKALSLADEILLLDIYPAREKPIEGVSSRIIGEKIKGKTVLYAPLNQTLAKLEEMESVEVVLSLGAGDIDSIVNDIKTKLEHKL